METTFTIDEQVHGYRSGHQLLWGSARLPRADQDLVDRLSDMAGQLRPGETFPPYTTGYPLPSGQHFVLARTWQDRAAPRSGCVWTHSLLVPMSLWCELTDVMELVNRFRKPESSIESAASHQVLSSMPPVLDPRRFELVEALFLEERQPIVMFDCSEAEIVAFRVVNALLPSLRAEFAFGTFALSPRTVETRSFDLLFAPADARNKFSAWKGRRIERPRLHSERTRHRWTADLASRIFEGTGRRLEVDTALGFAPHSERIDENALRLSLRWRELIESVPSSPMAALGLLDIINARGRLPLDQTPRLFPVLNQALTQAATHFPAEQAWSFLTALLAKLPPGRIPSQLRKSLREAVEFLTKRMPELALAQVAQGQPTGRPLPMLVEAWIGDALVEAHAVPQLWNVSRTSQGRLVAASRSLARHLTSEARSPDSRRLLDTLEDLTSIAPTTARRRLLSSVAGVLDRPSFAPWLAELLQGQRPVDIAMAAARLGRASGFAISAFDDAFLATGDQSRDLVRRAILNCPPTDGADRFLARTISLDAKDLFWLNALRGMEDQRKARVFANAIESCDDRSLRNWVRQEDQAQIGLELLASDTSRTGRSLARVLLAKGVTSQSDLAFGLAALPYTDALQDLLARELLAYAALKDETKPDQLATLTRAALRSSTSIKNLFELIFPTYQNAYAAARNLCTLTQAPDLRSLLVTNASQVSEQLMRSRHDYGFDGYQCWAEILTDSLAKRTAESARVAERVLDYALWLNRKNASALLVATFPKVYSEVKAGAKASIFSGDKSKWLVRDVTQAFIRSDWPPTDLLQCALRTGDAPAVLSEIAKARGGVECIEQMKVEIGTLPVAVQAAAVSALSKTARGRRKS